MANLARNDNRIDELMALLREEMFPMVYGTSSSTIAPHLRQLVLEVLQATIQADGAEAEQQADPTPPCLGVSAWGITRSSAAISG